MTINFDLRTNINFDFDYEEIARKVVEASLDEVNCPYEAEVNICLVDLDEIHSINLEYRQIDRPTDVLSFPLIAYDEPEDLEEEKLLMQDAFHPETGELMLGDIILCIPRIIEQASEYGHSILREYSFLIAHSMMHLFGHDHMNEDEEKIMFGKQEAILNKLNITR